MSPLVILLITAVVFFALNMGGSGIAPSFAAAYGSKLISRIGAVALFGFFVILGSVTLGDRVVRTLSSGIIAKDLFTMNLALIILVSAAVSLFIANLLKVPQSTSWVTVFATLGAALYFGNVKWGTLAHMIGMWLILPVSAFILTLMLFKSIYPARAGNFWFYEKIHNWKRELHILAMVSSCYVAFAIGSNNVANAVGPLAGANLIDTFLGLLLIAPLFGIGAFLIGERTIKTMGKEIVPLGLVTSTLISFVTASLLLVASLLGIPQSLVQLNACSILAVGTLKHEHVLAIRQETTRKMVLVWLAAPLLSAAVSLLLLIIFGGRR